MSGANGTGKAEDATEVMVEDAILDDPEPVNP